MKRFAACFLLLVLGANCTPRSANAQPSSYQVGNTTVSVSTLSTGLDTPWELLWGPDNFLWMTERGGRVSRVDPATGTVTPLLTIADVTETGESGLLGLAVVPGSASNQYSVFVVYNYTEGGQLKEKLVRYQYTVGTTTLSNPQVLLGNIPAQTTHSGSRLLLLPDNTLLMTTGDAQDLPSAQNRSSLTGKILRLNLDGTPPADNPVPGSLVYTLGHRNPQGLVRAPGTGKLYSSEHGPNNDDEVNLIEANRNYGWPNVEGACDLAAEQTFCQANNVREPLFAWTPTLGVSGLAYYDHPAIPEWRNNLLLLSLKAGTFSALPLSANGEQVARENRLWTGNYGRLRAICVSPQGRVYAATSNRDGRSNPAPTDDRILVLENRAFTPTSTTRPAALNLTLYPNPAPAGSAATVQLPTLRASATALLTDVRGRQVWQGQLASGSSQLILPPTAPGLYLLHLRTPDGAELRGRIMRP
ncbi:T9SS C-terminal target domain-containing protein [Hymenobacter oligotrophus]|uniref:T9SS C-terminal target domain-containing protein n=1 Tax=Hymenobacter oligotrophus TaxID=2319843 RepID=A0A3B7R4W4_9BACT|nr:PQQ-dependent sugar dehydrogenase [Hymenobacter oligotrophus]AYA38370.1 T9SS C-terminal target domain-containing protein [Hymenobacter oligotrophus]